MFLESLLRAARLGWRGLARRPLFAAATILTLALGIGANTAVVTVLRSLLIRPLPFADPERLVAIAPGRSFSNRELDRIRREAGTLDRVAGFSPGWLMALTGVPSPVQLSGTRVSGNVFEMLGVRPALGRVFGIEADTPGSDLVAVLSHRLWRDAFAADPATVGRSIALDGVSYQVIGVMPPGFQMFDVDTDLWIPLPMDPSAMTWAGASILGYGRLARLATVESATAELTTLARAIRDEFALPPDWTAGLRIVDLQESMVGSLRPMLVVLAAAVAFLLLIAIANVAGLVTLRIVERAPELAVRTSLGASRRQLLGLLLAESGSIAVVGGGLGIAIGVGGVAVLRRVLPADLPRLAELSVDLPVLLVSVLVTVMAAVAFGAAPLLGRRAEPSVNRLREGRAVIGGHRTRGILVAVEVALTGLLLIGTGLMTRSLMALTSVDPGLRTDHLLTMRLQPSGLGSPEALRSYWDDVLGRVGSVPGVTAAATILHLPTSGRSWNANIEVEGRPLPAGASPPRSAWQSVSEGYFSTAGVPLLAGRAFGAADRADAPPVAIVNRVFAERLFPGEDPLGRRIKAGNATNNQWVTIVGIVGAVRHDSLSGSPGPELYRPFGQRAVVATSLVIRTAVEPEALAATIRAAIWSVARDVPISEVHSMEQLYHRSIARPRIIAWLLAIFAAVGLALGVVGVFGIAASWARQRDREIAVRIALGADGPRVIRLVVGQALGFAAGGLVAGLGAGAALSGAMRGLLFEVTPSDPITFLVVAVTLGLMATLAAWIPARRASRAQPTAVLRE